jgi:hypothetical protein
LYNTENVTGNDAVKDFVELASYFLSITVVGQPGGAYRG